ncbi:MAG TPA: hypothetical protein VFA09_16450 [Ktedonobacteraceae bacterium]|nr:hypothetical protein [Ktedonobacteraceae bacterium]
MFNKHTVNRKNTGCGAHPEKGTAKRGKISIPQSRKWPLANIGGVNQKLLTRLPQPRFVLSHMHREMSNRVFINLAQVDDVHASLLTTH